MIVPEILTENKYMEKKYTLTGCFAILAALTAASSPGKTTFRKPKETPDPLSALIGSLEDRLLEMAGRVATETARADKAEADAEFHLELAGRMMASREDARRQLSGAEEALWALDAAHSEALSKLRLVRKQKAKLSKKLRKDNAGRRVAYEERIISKALKDEAIKDAMSVLRSFHSNPDAQNIKDLQWILASGGDLREFIIGSLNKEQKKTLGL